MKIVRHVTRPKKPKRPIWDEAFGPSSKWYKAMRRAQYYENRKALRGLFNWCMAWAVFWLIMGRLFSAMVIMVIAAFILVSIFVLRWYYLKWVEEQG